MAAAGESADFWLVLGDHKRVIQDTLKDPDGDPVNLTGAEVVLLVRNQVSGSDVLEFDATVPSPATAGIVQYEFQFPEVGDADLEAAGTYYMQWRVTFDTAQVLHFPSDGYRVLEVTAALS